MTDSTRGAITAAAAGRAVRAEDAFDVEAMAAWLSDHAVAGSTAADLSAIPVVEQSAAERPT